MQTYLLEATGRPPGAEEDATARLAGPVAYSHPSAPGFYAPWLSDPILVRRDIIGDRTFFGASKNSVGDATATNLGLLDELAGWAFDGRPCVSLVGEHDQPYDTFERVFSGTIEQLLRDLEKISFQLRDALALLDAKVQPATFAGDNAGDAGVEGTADTIGGRRKPVVVGRQPNCQAILVNSAKDTVQVADRAVAIGAVYAGGVAVDEGTEQASLEDLLDNAPSPGTYDWYAGPEGTFIRTGFVPRYAITADLLEGDDAADRTAGQVWRRVLMDRLGIDEAKISAADVAALDLVAPGEVGQWFADDRSGRALLDLLAASAAAWYGPDAAGIWRIKQIVDPAEAAPVATFKPIGGGSVAKATDFGLLELPESLTGKDPGRGRPIWRFDLGYAPNPLPQREADLGGDRTEPGTDAVGGLDRRAWLEQALRRYITSAGDVQALHPLAAEIAIDTALVERDDVVALGTLLLALFGPDREFLRCRIALTGAAAALLDLGKVISLELPRYTWAAGKPFLIVGLRPIAADNVLDVWIWG